MTAVFQPMKSVVVRQGEDLLSIAAEHGCDLDDLIALNRALLDRGRTPHVLAPGDVVRLPEAESSFRSSLKRGDTNTFVVKPSARDLEVDFGVEHASARAEISHASNHVATLDEAGVLRLSVPTHVRTVSVSLSTLARPTVLVVAAIDPVSTRSGQVERLRALGFFFPRGAAPHHASISDPLGRAWAAFQATTGSDETGIPTESDFSELQKAYGA